MQGNPGTADPLGEDIPIHYTCGVSRVPLASDANLTAAGAEAFLAQGKDLDARTSPCSNGGFVVEMAAVELGPRNATRANARAAGGPSSPSLDAAESAGKVDVIRFPKQTIVVTNDNAPVTVTLPEGTKIGVRRIDGDANGAPQQFGPLPGGIPHHEYRGAIQVDPVTKPPATTATNPPATPAGSGGGPRQAARQDAAHGDGEGAPEGAPVHRDAPSEEPVRHPADRVPAGQTRGVEGLPQAAHPA